MSDRIASLEVLLVGIGLGLAIGFFLAFLRYPWPAALPSFTCWASLGFVAAASHNHPSPRSTFSRASRQISSSGEENPYDHPSPELLQRLEKSGLHIFRTDQEGAVQVRTDGHNLNVSCFVACPGIRNPIRPRAGAR
jgi:hypothetical protein